MTEAFSAAFTGRVAGPSHQQPTGEAAREAYASPAYAASLEALGDCAERDFRIAEGLPQSA
jgi:hypothetical protein